MTRLDMKTSFCILVTLGLLCSIATPAISANLASDFKILLKENDRILGSLRGNFLVYGRPNITMYNQQGEAVFSRKLTNNIKPTLSPNGKYMGLITYADHSPTDLNTMTFEKYDMAGKFLWKLSKPSANSFMIADNGAIFGIEGVKGISPTRIHLYDQYGDLLNILTLKTYHGIAIAPSGGKFIIDKARDGLEVYDSAGNYLAALPVSKNYIFDRDQRYIATFFQGLFHLFQDEKEVISFKATEVVIRDMYINVEQNLVVLMNLKRLEVYELTTKKRLWEYRLRDERLFFTSLDVSADGQYIACGVDVNGGTPVPKEKRHVEGYLYLFPRDGSSLDQHQESYTSWATGLPKAVFAASSQGVLVQTREKLEKLSIKPLP